MKGAATKSFASSRRVRRSAAKGNRIMKPKQQKAARTLMKRGVAHKPSRTKHDWREFDALTDAGIHAAARSDPDAQPLSDTQLKRMSRPNPKVVRQALGLS